jgi:RimJ/RimL family protein N-acetyltransferase
MTWTITPSLTEFLAAAEAHLLAEPALNTVALTVCDGLRHSAAAAPGDHMPWFAWHTTPGGAVDGAALRTPPYPVLTAGVPAGSAAALLTALAGAGLAVSAVNLAEAEAPEFAAAWQTARGGEVRAHLRSRLYRLAALTPADPAPAGGARRASEADYELLLRWHDEFHALIGEPGNDSRRAVESRLGHGALMLWEDGGEPVSMAGVTGAISGVARVAPVYTPPRFERRGYGGGVTTAVTQAALDAGATDVVLFTDLANPVSNSLYQRLGYRPVTDRVVLELGQPGDVTVPPAASG